jgi:hypothetical protein
MRTGKKKIPAGTEFVKLDSCHEDFGNRGCSCYNFLVNKSTTDIPTKEELAEALDSA